MPSTVVPTSLATANLVPVGVVAAKAGAAPARGQARLRPVRAPHDLLAAHRDLDACRSVPELFGRACQIAREACGFSRALVVLVHDHILSTDGLMPLPDPASDALRRRLLARPVLLGPGTAEGELIKREEGGRATTSRGPSVLNVALELEDFALGVIMPEDQVLGLLVVDRSGAVVTDHDYERVRLFSHLVGCSVTRLVLRQRMNEFAGAMRHLSVSAHALINEGLEAAISLPHDFGAGVAFPRGHSGPRGQDQLRGLLTPREQTVLGRLADGRSNREIAEELHLSTETVKSYVCRVMRKLGASNRADAAVRYVRLTSEN